MRPPYHTSDDALWVVPRLEIEQFNDVERVNFQDTIREYKNEMTRTEEKISPLPSRVKEKGHTALT